VIINNGRILADGPTREIFDDVDTLTTAKLKPPQVTQLAQSLGARIPRTVLTIREMNQILAERLAG
jgi:energy-coupling factor transport system ATP-binding protein